MPQSEWFADKKQVGLDLVKTESSSQQTLFVAQQTVNISMESESEMLNKPVFKYSEYLGSWRPILEDVSTFHISIKIKFSKEVFSPET